MKRDAYFFILPALRNKKINSTKKLTFALLSSAVFNSSYSFGMFFVASRDATALLFEQIESGCDCYTNNKMLTKNKELKTNSFINRIEDFVLKV